MNDFIQALEWLKAGYVVHRKLWHMYAHKIDNTVLKYRHWCLFGGSVRWSTKDGQKQQGPSNVALLKEDMTANDWVLSNEK